MEYRGMRGSKKAKFKIIRNSIFITVVAIVLIMLVISAIFFKNTDEYDYETPNSYSFSGSVLSTQVVYPEKGIIISLEEENNIIYGITLKNNELIFKKQLTSDIDYSEIKEFNIVFSQYDNDGNKDFTYIYDKANTGYVYKFYTITKMGEIIESEIPYITYNSSKASIKVAKNGDKFEYTDSFFYYDGYKVAAEVGQHALEEKEDMNIKTISKNSKIVVNGKYNAIPRKYSVKNEIPEYVENVNSYFLSIDKKQCIEVDLDGDKWKEYVISSYRNGKTYVALFDSSANFITNIIDIDGEKDITGILEIADVDNDNIMEIVIPRSDKVEVHKFANGFYY